MQDEKPEINCVSSPFKQIVPPWLNWDGFSFVFHKKKGVDVILQRGVKAMVIIAGILNVVFDPPIHVGMADGIRNVVTEIAA